MEKIKVVFMGTPEFSVPILEGLIENYDVIGVVSQPDKKVGRRQTLQNTPVKEVALKHNIKVFQPINIKTEYEEILKLNPDIIITCAYGQIVPKAVLDTPKLGCINVHASLLPKLRGGAPIHKSIIDDYGKTGITIMYMSPKMDAGDIISSKETIIEENDNLDSLSARLSIMGKELLLETLPSIIRKENSRIKQNEEEVTYAYNITREEEHIDFSKSTRQIYNQIRGLSSTPSSYTILDDKEMKVYSSIMSDRVFMEKQDGEITNIYKEGIGVSTKDGEIILTEIKPFGKKRMKARDYLNGIKKEELIGKVLK